VAAVDPHRALREDVRLLGGLLGDALRVHEGEKVFQLVEQVRSLAKRAHDGEADRAEFQQLADILRALPLAHAVPVARAFAHFLTLANIAEQHHRVRRRREYAHASHTPQPGSCEEAFPRLLAAGIAPASLATAVAALRIELVLTAHPTEIARRTVIQAHRRIADALAYRDRTDLTVVEQDEAIEALRREVAIAWQTDESRDRPISPLDEVRGGLVVFEQTLWHAVPQYLRSLDRAQRAATGGSLPLDAAPIRFGSWIGGDRDGNPNVTPEVTRQATWLARWMAAHLYLRDVTALRDELSITTATDEMRVRSGGAREPYRELLREVARRLEATREWAAQNLDGTATPVSHERDSSDAGTGARDSANVDSAYVGPHFRGAVPYLKVAEFAAPLWICHRSLIATGNAIIAAGRLADLLRRIATFGLTLTPLDLRQESSRHAEAVAWIARVRGWGAYETVTEPDRVALLVRALAAESLPIGQNEIAGAPESVRDVIETMQTAAGLEADSLGAYVVTMTHQASDVLAVELLQRLAGTEHPQRVVPLFETVDDLNGAGAVLDDLLQIPWYRRRVGERVEVMVGYSDSAKDAGRLAAAWALYRAQEHIAGVCRRRGVAVTIFHGRGGSIGRGGGPTYLAIQSQPPGSVDGTFRVTEQGEMIDAKFGLVDIATRTLEVYTTATLDAMLMPAVDPDALWRAAMDRLSSDAQTAYQSIVYEHPQFVDYFRAATPEPELRVMHIGSRPARRATGGGVDSLRAIPWQFAWTQTRLLLASWLGTEIALDAATARGDRDLLRAMYARWPFFRSTFDLIEMVLAKADVRIAAEYDRRLVPPALQPLGRELRDRLDLAIRTVLDVTGHGTLVGTNRVLRRSIDTRNPYVDPINVVQIELVKRLRQSPDTPALRRAFAITVNGIAAGMRNTG